MTKSSPLSSSANRLPNGSIEITLTIPWADIQTAYEQTIKEEIAGTELPGFRKGKAPRHLVESKLDKSHTLSHALGHIIPDFYSQAVKDHSLKPVLYPNIQIKKGQEGQNWIILATTCETPEVTLPSVLKPPAPAKKLEDVLAWLIKNSQIKLPDLIVETESQHRLSQLAENLTQLGLSLDKYLQTKKITAEDLRAQTASSTRQDLTLEFVLQKVQVSLGLDNRQKTLDHFTQLASPDLL